MDTSIMIWMNTTPPPAAIAAQQAAPEANALNVSKSSEHNQQLVARNARRGESEDSDTDSEDEGYDSDVKREHNIDYSKSIFQNQTKRPSADKVLNMYDKVNSMDKR